MLRGISDTRTFTLPSDSFSFLAPFPFTPGAFLFPLAELAGTLLGYFGTAALLSGKLFRPLLVLIALHLRRRA